MNVQTFKDFDVGAGGVVEMEVASLHLTTNFILQSKFKNRLQCLWHEIVAILHIYTNTTHYVPSHTFILLQYRYSIVFICTKCNNFTLFFPHLPIFSLSY